MPQYDLVLFDMDGTLVDSKQSHRELFYRFWPMYYPEISRETMEANTIGNALQDIFRRMGFPESRRREVFHNLEAFYRTRADDIIETMAFVPGAAETLRAMRAGGVKTGMVTNSGESLAQKVAARNGAAEVFDFVVGADESLDHKAERFEKIFRTAGIEKSRILYVGDSEHDPRAAAQAGIDCCVLYAPIGWLKSEEDLMKRYMPDYIVKDIRKIANIVL